MTATSNSFPAYLRNLVERRVRSFVRASIRTNSTWPDGYAARLRDRRFEFNWMVVAHGMAIDCEFESCLAQEAVRIGESEYPLSRHVAFRSAHGFYTALYMHEYARLERPLPRLSAWAGYALYCVAAAMRGSIPARKAQITS